MNRNIRFVIQGFFLCFLSLNLTQLSGKHSEAKPNSLRRLLLCRINLNNSEIFRLFFEDIFLRNTAKKINLPSDVLGGGEVVHSN